MASDGGREAAVALGAAAVVVGELMAAGALEAGSPWAPLNAVAPLLLTPETAERGEWDPRVTPVGLGITLTGIAAWAWLHQRALARLGARGPAAAAAAGALSAAALALFDYRVLPPHRRPRFERWLSRPAIAAKYGALALVLVLGSRGAARP